MTAWKLMKSAPKDGTKFLGFWPSPDDWGDNDASEACVTTWWADGHWHNPWERDDDNSAPTHWKPLDPPPNG